LYLIVIVNWLRLSTFIKEFDDDDNDDDDDKYTIETNYKCVRVATKIYFA